MMGGGAFILLKAGRPERESMKQAEIRLASLPKIAGIARSGPKSHEQEVQRLHLRRFLRDMANSHRIGQFVIQITVLARKLAHYPAGNCRG
jgi:hypothetical protein